MCHRNVIGIAAPENKIKDNKKQPIFNSPSFLFEWTLVGTLASQLLEKPAWRMDVAGEAVAEPGVVRHGHWHVDVLVCSLLRVVLGVDVRAAAIEKSTEGGDGHGLGERIRDVVVSGHLEQDDRPVVQGVSEGEQRDHHHLAL